MADEAVPASLRRAVAERAAGCCEYCWSQSAFAAQVFSVDHIVPRHAGGRTTSGNLALCCQGCNNHKYTKTKGLDPISGELVSLYHPRRQRWLDHFAWSHDYSLILGLTPTGRATVAALRLNRPGLVNLG